MKIDSCIGQRLFSHSFSIDTLHLVQSGTCVVKELPKVIDSTCLGGITVGIIFYQIVWKIVNFFFSFHLGFYFLFLGISFLEIWSGLKGLTFVSM